MSDEEAFTAEDLPKPEIDKEAALRELEETEAELARRHLHYFVQKAWSIIEPKDPLVDNWHIRKLCRVLERVTKGDIKRLIINVPPGTMKSLLVSVFWPAWEWGSNPQLRYLTASYGMHLSTRDNLRLREIVQSPWYQKHFKLRLSGDQNAKQLFNTTEGGWRFATSVGGAGTGEHPDRIIIDDPLTAKQARSDVERKAANMWYDRTISTRGISRDARIVIIMQRLHQLDLSGHLLGKGGWEHVCWPMRFDVKRPDKRDPRTKPNELLWPQVFDAKKVHDLEIALDPYGAAGQLQQQPAPEGGGLFKRGWFKIVDAVPSQAARCRGWDTGGTEGDGDYTVGAKMAKVGPIFYIEDITRGQWSPATVEQRFVDAAVSDGKSCRQREEQEPGSAGKTVVFNRVRLLVGYDYRGVPISGDKITRARPFRAQCEAGNVFVLRAPWNEAFFQELESFPNGEHDDQVDACSAAFNELAQRPMMGVVQVAWG